MLAQTPAAQRITLVDSLSVGAIGDTLENVNPALYPDGALFFVNATQRMYCLQKNLPVTITAGDSAGNVVSPIGSDHIEGFFVACQQSAVVTLSGGAQTSIGWALPNASGYHFLATLVTVGGTTGFVHAARTDDHTVTVTSTQGADTGTYFVVLIPSGEG